MERVYDISLAEQKIGTAKVKQEGLYYRFQCKCRLSGDVFYKLMATCGNKSADLGVCVPIEGGYGLETKVPIKRLGEGELRFCAVPRHSDMADSFVPIRADEPFTYIEMLQKTYLKIRNGQIGVVLPKEQCE